MEPASRTASSLRPAPGSRIGRYELCEEIASGGMASVMLARATGPGGFDKLVALKLIHSRYATEPSFVEMFLDEARIASRIQHPNVCSVFDFGNAGGTYYLAMDFLEGQPVSRILKRLADDQDAVMNPVLVARLCRIIAESCEGLHAAHELKDDRGKLLGVVHRDVSPHNLFVTFDGGVRVVDFGIAEAAGKLHRTLTGVVKGKVAYMAPEQLRDQGIDRRADVWALGVTLWELLTLERLFRRDSEAGSIQAVLSAPIRPPSAIRPSIPPELDAIVLRALARDPAERTPTTRELGRALGQFVASTGQILGMAEMAEWMESLFPSEREEQRVLVERARATSPVRDTLPAPKSEEVTASGTRPTPPLVDTQTMPTQPERLTRATGTLGSSTMRLPLQRGPLAIGVVTLVAIGVLGAWWMTTRPDEPLNALPAPPLPKERPAVGASGETTAPSPSPAPAPSPAPSLSTDPSPHPSPLAGERGTKVGAGKAAPVAPRRSAGSVPGSRSGPAPGSRSGPAPGSATAPGPGSAPGSAPGPGSATGPGPGSATGPGPGSATGSASGPESPPAPAPSAPGTLDVATPGGWADVFVGGQRVGRSPCRVSLAAGHHVVELRPFGTGEPIRAAVDVPSAGAARLVRAVEGP